MADSSNFDDYNYNESSMTKYSKPVRLSLHLIVKRHLPSDASEWSQEKIIEELNKIRRVRLDRENVGEIDSMELLSNEVSNLYLQCNQIKRIENLECLPNLQVLVLSGNQIRDIEGISHLQRLVMLDLSENKIIQIDPDSFPSSLVILSLEDNPCTEAEYYREKLIGSLPKLKQLDGIDLYEDDDASSEGSEDDAPDTSVDDGEGQNTGVDGVSLRTSIRPESVYRQLPKIEMSISDMTTEMLIRSQNRLEDRNAEHKRLLQEMTNIKIKTNIRPLPQIKREK